MASTLQASRFGRGTIVTLHGYKLPPRHLLCPGFTRDPLPGWWDSHWHEIPDAEKAGPDMAIDQIKRLHHDYYLAWLIKVMLFAAGKEPPVTVWYAKNVACAGGRYSGNLRLALNEQPGTYHVLARDVASGLQAAAAAKVAKREVRP